MSRRRRTRALAPRDPEPLDSARAVARFGRLIGRGVQVGYVPWGPLVEADTPEELREQVEWALAAEAGRQRPS